MTYTSEDPVVRLAAVRQAISECLTAQEYQVGGTGTHRGFRRQQKARLDHLRMLEKDLMQEVLDTQGYTSLAIVTRVT